MADRSLTLRFIDSNDSQYAAERDLRWRLLRQPLGHARGSERFEFEHESLHLIACEGADVVGCVLFQADGRGGGRLFQMAVDPTLQGSGVGRQLVEHLEARLRADGLTNVILHSRDHAIGFYERLGYACFGAPYDEVGIPHRHMQKKL